MLIFVWELCTSFNLDTGISMRGKDWLIESDKVLRVSSFQFA